uniref:Tetratricopeptide repeat-like domain-containing protein n=1 Tax=Parascaris univalens TaxID=6257 RepID=A0A915BR99_PARUN
VLGDKVFQQAVARSSYGRRPKSSMRLTSSSMMRLATSSNRINTSTSGLRGLTTTMNTMTRSSLASRSGTDAARPMTAVRAAGYTSAGGRGSSFDPMKMSLAEKPPDESNEEKCRQMEKKVNDLLKESVLAWEKGEMKQALDKAKEAGRKERAAVKMREQLSVVDQLNLDLTFTVLFNLAHQYAANDLLTEALNTYQVIVKNKMFANSGRLKVNIGNIYFKKKDYKKAIKYYRMALDQVPSVQKDTRIKILNNIGVAFIKCGEYDEAANTFEHCMEEKGDYGTALNLILTAYYLEDIERMKDAFQRLVDIPLLIDDEPKYMEQEDFLLAQLISNDSLKQWERHRRQTAERTILIAAKIISSAIAMTYAEGYAWCVDAIKQSIYAPLAMELEMNKAVELLRQGDLATAQQILLVFNNKESKVASAAANNLALLNLLQGPTKIDDAIQYCEQSLSADRYNSNALVNRGNIFFAVGDLDKAYQYYKEALSNEASCVQALYNMGYVCRLQGKMEAALDCFYKLHSMVLNNVEVLCQLAAIYESLEDTAQAIELYSQANSLAPTDPAILSKLANIYDAEGDKSQAFQCHYDSYRYFPSNIGVIEWLGAYYIDAQFPEKAVNYFEKASIMEPNEIKWQLMMASCQRRSGNYQKALDLYRQIHRRFPENIECLKFLVRICTDLGMPEAKEFMEKLSKAEKVRQLRMQRESDSSQGKRSPATSAQSLPPHTSYGRPSSRSSLRTSSARLVFDKDEQYQVTQRKMNSADYSYKDPLGPAPTRPKTGTRRRENDNDELFENEQLDESLLPE